MAMSYGDTRETVASERFADQLDRDRQRARGKITVTRLATKSGIPRNRVGHILRGREIPTPAEALKLADALDAPRLAYVLSALAATNTELKELVDPLRTAPEMRPGTGKPRETLRSHLSLLDFPDAFTPMVVVVGDKRESDPRTPGDLYTYPASSVDDRWLCDLQLPPGTEKLSDKVLMSAWHDRAWLKSKLGSQHLLIIGSPASNLMARYCNSHFLFRFAVEPWLTTQWDAHFAQMVELDTAAKLISFRDSVSTHLKSDMRHFVQPGFIALNDDTLKIAYQQNEHRDFAVVSIGRNPFAETEDNYFAILAAGVHHPGTAHAVRWLGNRTNFISHPFGGVLEIQVPSDATPADEVRWHTKIEQSAAAWHTIGQSDLSYTPDALLDKIANVWLPLFASGDASARSPMATRIITKDELHGHLELIERLASAATTEEVGT
jgi:transcriptional regulator with XRE-family HTH domain